MLVNLSQRHCVTCFNGATPFLVKSRVLYLNLSLIVILSPLCVHPVTEAFIRNFSAPYSLLQRHLVGEEDRKGGAGETRHPEPHQHSPPRPLIAELTTSSFLPCVMDLQKVRKYSFPVTLQHFRQHPNSADLEWK